ncbi:pyrroline-5-carboxylate reductase, partial [Xanthomonas campestris pv. trichodesmae]|nr:pyrroline-5-carboxylate reductase [Xanthomonas campestris pv. trichodesmae]
MNTPASSSPSSSATTSIAFVGGGNMARSLIAGLIRQGTPAASIRVAEPVADLREALARDFGVQVVEDARAAVDAATTWVLAVKPQILPMVCAQLADLAQAQQPLLVSIAAGITATQLQRWSGGDIAVVRAMPNTPALLGAGVTGLYANARVSATQRQQATQLLGSAGVTVWIDDEAQMDAVTAVSGSG